MFNQIKVPHSIHLTLQINQNHKLKLAQIAVFFLQSKNNLKFYIAKTQGSEITIYISQSNNIIFI